MAAVLQASQADPRALDAAALAELLEAAAAVAEPPPKRTAEEWAEANRILPPDAPFPGPWRSHRAPYMTPIAAAFADWRIERVIAVMGAQMGKTELVLNLIGHWFDDGPLRPVLYVGPTQKQVTTVFGDRLPKMIESTPRLRDRLARGQRDKTTEKWIGGVRLGAAWAGSATELASNPAARVLVDERDRMDSDVDGEGDPVELCVARMDAYEDRKLGVFSTPTVEGASPIWSLFEEGTMQKWAWPCDHCGHAFIPCLAHLKFDPGAPLNIIRATARVACPHCGGEHDDARRFALNARGVYIPHRLDGKGDHVAVDAPAPLSCASFWVSGLASPTVSFGESAERLAAAYRSHEQGRIQGVINTRFGELFKLRGDAPEWAEVLGLARPVPRGELPPWATLVTVGTDVQRDGLFYVVRAWGFDLTTRAERSHLLDHGFIAGDTEFDDVWLSWSRQLAETYREPDRDLARHVQPRELGVRLALCDSGYNPRRDRFKRPEHKVYEACRRTGWKALPSKGHDAQDTPVKLSKIDRLPSGRVIVGGLNLWHVDTDHFKTWLHGAIRRALEEDDPAWTLHAEADEDYARQLVSEELVIKPSGQRVWILPGKRANHYLDCEVLARAAAYVHRAQIGQGAAMAAEQGALPAPRGDTPRPPAVDRPADSYFRIERGSYFRR